MKVADSYANLVRGVSQQVPHNRFPGQHTEQVNMQPDPVEGLARRHGSILQAERLTGLDPALMPNFTADTAGWQTFEYENGGKEYVLMVRREARASGSTLPLMVAYNRTDKVFLPTVRNAVDPVLDQLEAGGVSAITAVGRYVFMAGNTVLPAASTMDLWSAPTNAERTVVWIRGGAYSRTYKVTATPAIGSPITFQYTTPSSSYQELLDTSVVPLYILDPAGGTVTDNEAAYVKADRTFTLSWGAWSPTVLTAKKGGTTMTNVYPALPTTALQYSWNTGAATVLFSAGNVGAVDITLNYTHLKTLANPNYAATVGDLTNDYNSRVTAWIGTSADAIQPEAICEQLRLAAIAAGISGAARTGSTLVLAGYVKVECGDGGDDSLIRGVDNEISDVGKVSTVHHVGKIVKVRSRSADESFYLRAVPEDLANVTGYVPVYWVEGVGVQTTITQMLQFATAEGGNMLLASSPALMDALSAADTPTYSPSTCGDLDSSPLPFFIGRKISYLGVFQDRLIVGSSAVLRASVIGDYLNFHRGSILTLAGDDPIEWLPKSEQDDEMRYSVSYDRDLVIFGKKNQYVVSGRVPLTPTNANLVPMSAHADAADSPPLAVGGLIFYAKRGVRSSSLHEVRPGQNVESPESFDISSQLNTYIVGNVIELADHAKPAVLFARSTGARNSIYTFHYIDGADGRKQDAWHRWDFAAQLGPIIGMSRTPAGLLVFTLRSAPQNDGTPGLWSVADLVPLTTELSLLPYLDSQRPWPSGTGVGTSINASTSGTNLSVAYDHTTVYRLLGSTWGTKAQLLLDFPSATGGVAGFDFPAFVTLTNPYRKDRNGVSILSGQLTVTALAVSIADSSGFKTTITTRSGAEDTEYNGRVVGDPNNVVGREVVTSLKQSVPVGCETRDYSVSLQARKWLPLTITSVEWVGQFFNRTTRF